MSKSLVICLCSILRSQKIQNRWLFDNLPPLYDVILFTISLKPRHLYHMIWGSAWNWAWPLNLKKISYMQTYTGRGYLQSFGNRYCISKAHLYSQEFATDFQEFDTNQWIFVHTSEAWFLDALWRHKRTTVFLGSVLGITLQAQGNYS